MGADSTNSYAKGYKVTHNGKTWVSDVDSNVVWCKNMLKVSKSLAIQSKRGDNDTLNANIINETIRKLMRLM